MITAAGQRKHAIPLPSVFGLRIDEVLNDRSLMRVNGAGSTQPRDRLLNDPRLILTASVGASYHRDRTLIFDKEARLHADV